MLKTHFQNHVKENPRLIENVEKDMYVDLISGGRVEKGGGGNTSQEVETIKHKSIELFRKGGFNLHKWHCNKAFTVNFEHISHLVRGKCRLGTLDNPYAYNTEESTTAKQLHVLFLLQNENLESGWGLLITATN